ncbi:MAG: hypothetical protein IT429_13825 [Gemmataceae bacterium]|nr:hypothetical protein [Gemmataceae bacterium]
MPAVILTERTELVNGQRRVRVRTARVEVSTFDGRFDLTRADIQATVLVEAICPRGECPLLARRGEIWTLSGYPTGLPRLVLPVLPTDILDIQPPADGDRWQRVYTVSCLIVGRPSVDDPHGLFPGGIREGQIELADLAAILSEGMGEIKTAAFNTEGGFRWPADGAS